MKQDAESRALSTALNSKVHTYPVNFHKASKDPYLPTLMSLVRIGFTAPPASTF